MSRHLAPSFARSRPAHASPSGRAALPVASRCALRNRGALRIAHRLAHRIALLAALTLLPAFDTFGPAAPNSLSASPQGGEVLGPGRGFARAAADRKPVFLMVVPADSLEPARAWKDSLGKSTQRRLAKDFIVIELLLGADGTWPKEEPAGAEETPVPWEAKRAKSFLEGRLGVLGESPVVAIFDFSGVLLARDDGELPKESKLRKVLKAAIVTNQKMDKRFAEVEKGVKVIGLAMKKKKYPDACRAYASIEGLEIPLDSAPALARAERYRELKTEFEKQRAVAEKYEKDEDLASAVSEYEQVLAAFPLREWQGELRDRIGVLWRRIYGGTGGVGGGTRGGGR